MVRRDDSLSSSTSQSDIYEPLVASSSAPSRRTSTSLRNKIIIGLLVFLGLFLIGTVIVLSSIKSYFAIPEWAYITESEIGGWDGGKGNIREFQTEAGVGAIAVDAEGHALNGTKKTVFEDGVEWAEEGKGSAEYWMRADWNGTVRGTDSWDRLMNVTNAPNERIPRLIHQTWKSDTLPEKWRKVWRECREGMPDYEYMLWTDELSRQFIAEKYPSFLALYDGYEYPIQRADAIRYFVLHQFGGIYMDLDIGCKRRLEPLLGADWDVILPRTKPVGVSNDLIFSSKRSPFMEQTIHGLPAFNHRYLTNYPTVMFSTGPMFLSAQYGLYQSAHPLTPQNPRAEVRILPKPLYGKNAKQGEAPHSFFSHFYGSSWHADDAGFITFLGSSGKVLMYVGSVVVILGGLRFCLLKTQKQRSGRRTRSRGTSSGRGRNQGRGRRTEGGDDYMLSLLPTTHAEGEAEADGDYEGEDRIAGRSSISSDDMNLTDEEFDNPPNIMRAMRRAGHIILAAPATLGRRARGGRRAGMFYFLPAFLVPEAQGQGLGQGQGNTQRRSRPRTASMASNLPSTRSTRSSNTLYPSDAEASSEADIEPGSFLIASDEEKELGITGSSLSSAEKGYPRRSPSPMAPPQYTQNIE